MVWRNSGPITLAAAAPKPYASSRYQELDFGCQQAV